MADMVAFKSITGCSGILENILCGLKLKELAAFVHTEPIISGLVAPKVWAFLAAHQLKRYAFAKGSVETFDKEDAVNLTKFLKAIWVSSPKRPGGVPPVLVPSTRSSRMLLQAVKTAEQKARRHTAAGGSIAKVFVARFLFDKEALFAMNRELARRAARTEPAPEDEGIPFCESHIISLPLVTPPPRRGRGRSVRNSPNIQVKAFWMHGSFWLNVAQPEAGPDHLADLAGVSENVSLRMTNALLAHNRYERGFGLCAVTNKKALLNEISSEGLTCVLFVRDPLGETDTQMAVSRDVHALHISFQQAYRNKH